MRICAPKSSRATDDPRPSPRNSFVRDQTDLRYQSCDVCEYVFGWVCTLLNFPLPERTWIRRSFVANVSTTCCPDPHTHCFLQCAGAIVLITAAATRLRTHQTAHTPRQTHQHHICTPKPLKSAHFETANKPGSCLAMLLRPQALLAHIT